MSRLPYVCFFGLQYILKRWLTGPVVTRKAVEEAKELYKHALRTDTIFNEAGWNYIIEVSVDCALLKRREANNISFLSHEALNC